MCGFFICEACILALKLLQMLQKASRFHFSSSGLGIFLSYPLAFIHKSTSQTAHFYYVCFLGLSFNLADCNVTINCFLKLVLNVKIILYKKAVENHQSSVQKSNTRTSLTDDHSSSVETSPTKETSSFQ